MSIAFLISTQGLLQYSKLDSEALRLLQCWGYVATQILSISGSELARRFNVDHSALSQATQRVSRDPELPAATKTIQREPELEENNIETTSY